MKFLLDVNALIAWAHPSTDPHVSFHIWAKAQGYDQLATCALSELGFLRVTMQRFGFSLAQAQAALEKIRSQVGGYAASPPPNLPAWAGTAAKTSDAYLVQVAAAAGLELATFDVGIPGAVLI